MNKNNKKEVKEILGQYQGTLLESQYGMDGLEAIADLLGDDLDGLQCILDDELDLLDDNY